MQMSYSGYAEWQLGAVGVDCSTAGLELMAPVIGLKREVGSRKWSSGLNENWEWKMSEGGLDDGRVG